MDILDELANQGDRPTHEQHERVVRRMKRDRATIRKLEQHLRWYDSKVSELKRQLAEQVSP